jgi:hypothetical protein
LLKQLGRFVYLTYDTLARLLPRLSDCCERRRFLVMTTICLCQTLGGMFFRVISIAASSAVYRLYSSLVPRVTAYCITASLAMLKRVSCTLSPIPTTPFFTDALVATTMPVALLAISAAFFRPGSSVVCRQGSQGGMAYPESSRDELLARLSSVSCSASSAPSPYTHASRRWKCYDPRLRL